MVAQPDKRIIRSVFDVYLSGNYIIYVKEDCRPADTRAKFFLHVTPVDDRDLPEERHPYGFENLDFARQALEIEPRRCAVRRVFPAYPIRHIRTGQFVREVQGNYYVNLWEAEFPARGVEARIELREPDEERAR